MKKILIAFLALFSASATTPDLDLIEFSTSMDFEEFETVLKHLETDDKTLAGEMTMKINQFKNSSAPGQSQKFKFDKFRGYMILEREDDYAFGIATFTSFDTHKKIDAAYEQGIEDLGI